MIENLAIGCVTIVACIIIQCIFVGVLVATLFYLEKNRFINRTFVGLSVFGLITAFLFAVIYELMEELWNTRIGKNLDSD